MVELLPKIDKVLEMGISEGGNAGRGSKRLR